MEFNEVIGYCEQTLTNELKNLIYSEGLVKTGTMLHSTYVKISYSNNRLSIKVVSTDYYDDVNNRRKYDGDKTLNELLFESQAFQDCKQKIYKSILQQKKQEIVNELKK